MNAYPEKQQYTADDLAAIIAILRDPENGCPWDKVQTHTSIRMNFLEEAYEAVDAIDLDDPELMCEELGDVLMQVVFHAQIEREAGHFTFAEVHPVKSPFQFQVCQIESRGDPGLLVKQMSQTAG